MITINLETGFAAYLVGALLIAFLVALYEGWYQRAHGWKLPEEHLCRCGVCHRVFVVHRHSRTARCPRCNKLCTVHIKH
jgi:uncharacterized paraquat-inducible protein A